MSDPTTTMISGMADTIRDQQAQIKRLQAALHKCDKWGTDILHSLIEDGYITREDMQ